MKGNGANAPVFRVVNAEATQLAPRNFSVSASIRQGRLNSASRGKNGANAERSIGIS